MRVSVRDIILYPKATLHGPAVGFAPRDFAGSEERGRGDRAALSEARKASEFDALPRLRDERVYAHERGTNPAAGT